MAVTPALGSACAGLRINVFLETVDYYLSVSPSRWGDGSHVTPTTPLEAEPQSLACLLALSLFNRYAARGMVGGANQRVESGHHGSCSSGVVERFSRVTWKKERPRVI